MSDNTETEQVQQTEQKLIITLTDNGLGQGHLDIKGDPAIIINVGEPITQLQQLAVKIAMLVKNSMENSQIDGVEVRNEETAH